MSEKINLNIQPQSSVYALFTRLSYFEWYALAEFVDNSTASYYLHKSELLASHFDKLTIDINYDSVSDTITIWDNAFGMEIDEFKRAILLDSKHSVSSRNEFGYGLKTAATWFGKKWTVESTQLDSTKLYKATIDIDDLVSSKRNDTDIEVLSANYNDHYTRITIKKLNRRLNTTKIKNNIITILNSIYRRDLKEGSIEIIYNGTTLNFSDYPILHFRNKDWKKDIAIDFDFDGKHYSAKGFVGIMSPGGYEKTGFALFRNDRAIITNFKPPEIFGSQAQTQISLKLFGELDMDSFDVNQAKDGFSWNAELLEKFVIELKSKINDYIEVAKLSVNDRNKEESQNSSASTQTKQQEPNVSSENNSETSSTSKNEVKDIKNVVIPNESCSSQSIAESTFIFKYNSSDYHVEWTNDLSGKFIYNYDRNNLILKINNNHDYIKNILKNIPNKEVSRLILAYVLAEEESKNALNSSGYVQTSFMHNQFDKILSLIK